MAEALHVLMVALLLIGSVFCMIGGLGLHRLPDFYSRLHAAGVTDSLGAVLILLGLTVEAGFSLVTIKLLTIIVFAYLSGPAATQALAKAAYSSGLRVAGDLRRLRQEGVTDGTAH